MPLISDSTYRPPPGFRNGHVASIYPSLARRVRGVKYTRRRINTPDGDFLDLDFCARGSDNLIILSHGLEGSSGASYIMGMARAFKGVGWDALAWNNRGCSGEENRTLSAYHSGATHDLHAVVQHVLDNHAYRNIVLAGFSLGGNMTLKYVGEMGRDLDRRVRKAIAFSVPADLEASSRALARPENRIYMEAFLKTLRKKVAAKQARFPGRLAVADLKSIRTFQQFDDLFTGPAHGFADAMDYWRSCSAVRFLHGIRVPTLLVNARNDPFLNPECFPLGAAADSDWFHFEAPEYGGHVGFVNFRRDGLYWSEQRALEFVHGRVYR